MSEYNRDQLEAIGIVRSYLDGLTESRISGIKRLIRPYLQFRADVGDFQKRHLARVCTQKCFTGRTSACCNREGIAAFFADVLTNILLSSDAEIDALMQALSMDPGGFKCVYLGTGGCLWRLKPIVCEMFLCDHAKKTLPASKGALLKRWEALRQREKEYTWPDKPVLFDELEEILMKAGFDSPLMYFHHSPGLLRIKTRSRLTR